MSRVNSKSITPNQYALLIIGFIVQIGILTLPRDIGEISLQDSWISVLLGGIYPVYLALLGLYVSKRYPNDNILSLSKKYFGKFFGSALNLLFLCSFFTVAVSTVSGITSLIRVYVADFLKPLILMTLVTTISAYAAYSGLKVIAKISEIIFYMTLTISFIPLFSIGKGSILNLQPFGGSGLLNIAKGSIQSFISYYGFEVMFLIYPLVNNKAKIKKATWGAVIFTIAIYTWFTFMTVYYLDPDTTIKRLWPFLAVTEGIRIPIINNFRYFFIIMWSFVIFKALSITYYLIVVILSDTFRIENDKKIYLYILPLVVILAFMIPNDIFRREIMNLIIFLQIAYNMFYITTITLFVTVKG